jgi:hypothetical protein
MKCYNHVDCDAVGTCKHCSKGVCRECAKESGWGIVCSQACEVEVQALRAMVERNRKLVSIGAKTHQRNAVILFAMAAVFVAFGIVFRGPISVYMYAFGVIMLVSGGFAIFNSRRIAKL